MPGIFHAGNGNGQSKASASFAAASCPPKRTDWQAQVYAATDGGWTPPGAKR